MFLTYKNKSYQCQNHIPAAEEVAIVLDASACSPPPEHWRFGAGPTVPHLPSSDAVAA